MRATGPDVAPGPSTAKMVPVTRIIAGQARGRRLAVPPGRRVRPTTDRVRESVFSMLGSMDLVVGARVLDLFAGTGALGLEALSRGAAEAVFVERDRAALAALRANIGTCGFGSRARVVASDAERFLAAGGTAPDLVLADPPYRYGRWSRLAELLPAAPTVLETGARADPAPLLEVFEVARDRRIGDTRVLILIPRSGG